MNTTIGVDLGKNVIQVSVINSRNKELLNKELTRKKFAEFLTQQKPSLIAFESCATAHYWARKALSLGHETKIIPAKSITPFRQGHKTDKNDALAVAEAARRPNIKVSPLKSIDHQGMQAIQRSRELLVREKVKYSNHMRGILLEFGIVIPQGFLALKRRIAEVLDNHDSELPMIYHSTLACLFEQFNKLLEDIKFLDQQIKAVVKNHQGCNELMALEGVGPISALLLYATFGTGEAFKNGREFSAYIGLTPKQYSSGGKQNIIGISKHVANRRLRAVIIEGASAYVHRRKSVTTPKDRWLTDLIQRVGHGKAAVALANKNVRTAWAILTHGTCYNKFQDNKLLNA